jgi:predicted aconitase
MTEPVALSLSDADRAMLEGADGPAIQTAMRLIVGLARAAQAPSLLDISGAHIDGCLFHGQAGLDFAERLAADGATVRVPTTLNVSSLDLLHPDLIRSDPGRRTDGRRLMDAYRAMGAAPTWTCAPYQLPVRPGLGDQVAWGESNAIVFANSVLGARTERYGDFTDICAAITGRVPAAGLHLAANRRAGVVFDVRAIPPALMDEDVLYPVLGHLLGGAANAEVIAIDGLPTGLSEDRLKALGAAAASAGRVALCHVVGTTPEAATLEDATGGREPKTVAVTMDAVRAARDDLSTTGGSGLTTVSLGTPHYSVAEFERLVELLDGRRVHEDIAMYASTGRGVLEAIEARGWATTLEAAGVRIVTDTCTYVTSILRPADRVVMTDSAKWAYYAPGNLGVAVVFGSAEECIRSAVEGRVWRRPDLWG